VRQQIPPRELSIDLAADKRLGRVANGDSHASYYSIPVGGDRSLNAVWSYETPFEAMAQIKDYLAFYPDRIDAIEEQPAA
jgi:uncharacterized protein (DUF427 family)